MVTGMRELVLMTTRQVAEAARVDTSTVRRWVAAGRLRPVVMTPGGYMRFDQQDVDALLKPTGGAA